MEGTTERSRADTRNEGSVPSEERARRSSACKDRPR